MQRYDALSKLLHHIVLGHTAVLEAGFDIEWLSQRRSAPPSVDGAHVFVAGLARAGTTILMRTLYACGAFCSLTYRDMPFVLAPNLWARIGRRRQRRMDAEERAHGDGLLVDFDSPEALEEVFWRVFAGDAWIGSRELRAAPLDDDVVERFRNYVSLILRRYGRSRYLSKNNNNLLRIDGVLRAFPNAVFLVPFRDPVQQAMSLLAQHRRFCRLHEDDAFAKRYMRWLVHHEFGGDHRPFEWGREYAGDHDPGTVDYWLAQWCGAYGHVLRKTKAWPHRVHPVDYDLLCQGTRPATSRIEALAGVDLARDLEIRPPPRHDGEVSDTANLSRATDILDELKAVATAPAPDVRPCPEPAA